MVLVPFLCALQFYRVTRVKKATKATGVGNVLGNKGAAGIGFHYYETRIAFVTSHLAAHQVRAQSPSGNTFMATLLARCTDSGGNV